MVLEFDAPLLRWGNSYALRITRKQAQALGARPGVPLRARIEAAGMPEWTFPTFTAGGVSEALGLMHDELAGKQAEEDWKEWQES